MSALNKLTISEVSKGLKAKDFSVMELVSDCFSEIEKRNESLNAYVYLDKEAALKRAEGVNKKIEQGEDLGVLAGVPVGMKDILNTKGVKTTCCSPILKDFVPPYSATVVKKLDQAGMVMLGKTNMDEFACGGSTEHSCFGPTRNPHDEERVAGGSSGGSAAAMAADMCTYAIGTDTGGSIRQPASFCGVYGMKPSYGRVSRSGVTAMASSLDCVGTFGRCTEDIALVMQVIAGSDEGDMTTPRKEVPDYSSFLDQDIKGMKIALPNQYFGEGVDREVAETVKAAARKFEAAGAVVDFVDLPMTKYAVAVYYIVMPAELSANLERFDGIRYGKGSKNPEDMVDYYFKARGEGFGDEIKRRIMVGTYVLSAGYFDAYYKKAQKVRTLIIQDFEKVFADYDVILAPVAPTPAYKVGELSDDPLAMYMSDALTIPASIAGLAAMSVPAGTSKNGLPIGMQVIAPQFEEGRCLKLSSAFEKLD